MECKFITNGIAIDYFGTIKPCCVFRRDQDYNDNNNIHQVSLVDWHQSQKIINIKKELAQDRWPKECSVCRDIESQGRGDSMRLNAQSSYKHYDDKDITLEIRGGSVCNFACQTCWPQASSRVAQYYRQSNMDFVPSQDMDWDFSKLDSIKHRLRDIILLGGEPFYDKRCLKFLDWLVKEKVTASVTIFTNGSVLNRNFLNNYEKNLTLVFSIDAVDLAAEYIRFGTDWKIVKENYMYCRQLPNVQTRINVTTSPYNYYYLPNLMSWISQDWPSVVSFGAADTSTNSSYMDESVFKTEHRSDILTQVIRSIDIVKSATIEEMQKINAINALEAIVNNLKNKTYDHQRNLRLKSFIESMDRVKNIDIWNYCPEIAGYLDINPNKLEKLSPVFLTSDK